MKNTIMMFKTSSQEFKRVSCLTACSMLVALSTILGYFSFYLSPSIRISFTFIPIAIIGYLYGPVVGAFAGGAVDLINYMMKPAAGFTPGITLCAILTGFIYGCFLYRRKVHILRTALAVFCNTLFADLLLKSYVLAILRGVTFKAMIITRFPVQVIMLVLNTIMIFLLAKTLSKSGIFKLIQK